MDMFYIKFVEKSYENASDKTRFSHCRPYIMLSSHRGYYSDKVFRSYETATSLRIKSCFAEHSSYYLLSKQNKIVCVSFFATIYQSFKRLKLGILAEVLLR